MLVDLKRTLEVNESVQGTQLRGAAMVEGVMKLGLKTSSQSGELEARVTGSIASQLIGSRKAATVWICDSTQLEGTVPITVTGGGASMGSPEVRVESNSIPVAADFAARIPLVRRVGSRLALRAAWRQKPRSDRLVEERTKRQLAVELRKECGHIVAQVNRAYQDLYLLPLARHGVHPETKIRTTEVLPGGGDHLCGCATARGAGLPAADSPRPLVGAAPISRISL